MYFSFILTAQKLRRVSQGFPWIRSNTKLVSAQPHIIFHLGTIPNPFDAPVCYILSPRTAHFIIIQVLSERWDSQMVGGCMSTSSWYSHEGWKDAVFMILLCVSVCRVGKWNMFDVSVIAPWIAPVVYWMRLDKHTYNHMQNIWIKSFTITSQGIAICCMCSFSWVLTKVWWSLFVDKVLLFSGSQNIF